MKTKNPPGTITKNLWNTIKEGFNLLKPLIIISLIVVNGEEDLAVIPCVVMAPHSSIIFYGQPGKGVVFCEVDQIKEKAENLSKNLRRHNNGN